MGWYSKKPGKKNKFNWGGAFLFLAFLVLFVHQLLRRWGGIFHWPSAGFLGTLALIIGLYAVFLRGGKKRPRLGRRVLFYFAAFAAVFGAALALGVKIPRPEVWCAAVFFIGSFIYLKAAGDSLPNFLLLGALIVFAFAFPNYYTEWRLKTFGIYTEAKVVSRYYYETGVGTRVSTVPHYVAVLAFADPKAPGNTQFIESHYSPNEEKRFAVGQIVPVIYDPKDISLHVHPPTMNDIGIQATMTLGLILTGIAVILKVLYRLK